jgi:hypothetical protein
LTGDTINPEHFYGIFIDNTIKTIFIYNSMPLHCLDQNIKENQLKEYYKNNNQKIRNTYEILKFFKNYNVVVNRFRNQFSNDLCGIFSLKFLLSMTITLLDPMIEFKTKFNLNINMDKAIEEYQNFIFDNSNEKKSVIRDFFFRWFSENNQLNNNINDQSNEFNNKKRKLY